MMFVGQLENFKERSEEVSRSYYEKQLGSINKRKSIIDNYTGKVGLMCPYCYHTFVRNLRYRVVSVIDNIDPEDDTNELYFDFNEVAYLDECPMCGSKGIHMIILDPNITDAIGLLNRKGYFTMFCCEGHQGTAGCDCLPYVYFKNTGQMKKIIHTLPISWYVDLDSLKGFKRMIIRTEYENKHEALIDLLDWAKSLAYADNNDIMDTIVCESINEILGVIHERYDMDTLDYDVMRYFGQNDLLVNLGYKMLGL